MTDTVALPPDSQAYAIPTKGLTYTTVRGINITMLVMIETAIFAPLPFWAWFPGKQKNRDIFGKNVEYYPPTNVTKILSFESTNAPISPIISADKAGDGSMTKLRTLVSIRFQIKERCL